MTNLKTIEKAVKKIKKIDNEILELKALYEKETKDLEALLMEKKNKLNKKIEELELKRNVTLDIIKQELADKDIKQIKTVYGKVIVRNRVTLLKPESEVIQQAKEKKLNKVIVTKELFSRAGFSKLSEKDKRKLKGYVSIERSVSVSTKEV